MNFEEFLVDKNGDDAVDKPVEEAPVEPEELDVQKAVVEELAADKAALEAALAEKTRLLEEAKAEKVAAVAELTASYNSKIAELEQKLAAEQERHFDEQARNPNALALLDRDVDLPDRFPGETRDHVLEVIKAARDKAEADGRVRCAQLLEGVLLANEPNGDLAKRRAALEKFFADNGNILTGPVIEQLDRAGISYKKGEEYLLTSEILLRTY